MEPTEGCRGPNICKRWTKHHTGDLIFSAILVPGRIITALVQVIGRALARTAQFVVVERQRRVPGRVADIGFIHGLSQIARIARTAVDVGVGLIDVVGIIDCALTTHQTGASSEHISR